MRFVSGKSWRKNEGEDCIEVTFQFTPKSILSIRVVLISDTHSQHERLGKLPLGDLLIHAGLSIIIDILGQFSHSLLSFAGDFVETRPPKPDEYIKVTKIYSVK